jgi:hypothetical protein
MKTAGGCGLRDEFTVQKLSRRARNIHNLSWYEARLGVDINHLYFVLVARWMLLATKLYSNLITSSKISQQNGLVAKYGFNTTSLRLIAQNPRFNSFERRSILLTIGRRIHQICRLSRMCGGLRKIQLLLGARSRQMN